MSAKNLDAKGRLRSIYVGFRVSPEEDRLLENLVELSGMTKQGFNRRLKKICDFLSTR